MRFRSTLSFVTLALVAGIVALAVFAIDHVLARSAERGLQRELARTERVLDDVQQFKASLLAAEARAVAQEPRIKAVIATPDVSAETVLGVVREVKKAMAGDLMIITDAAGDVVADAGDPDAAGHSLAANPVVAAALAGGSASGIWTVDHHPYQVAAVRLTFGATNVGVVVIGSVLDDRFAETVRGQTGSMIVLEIGSQPVARSSGLADLEGLEGVAVGQRPRELALGGKHYLAKAVAPSTGSADLRYVILCDSDEATADERGLVRLVYLIALGGLVIALVVSLVFATRLSRPIDHLIELSTAVARGDLDGQAPVTGPTELRTLGTAVNQMVSELRSLKGGLEQRVEERTRELNLTNRKLTDATAFLQDVYQTMPGALFVLDRDGVTVAVNASACALLGYLEHELIGKPAAALVEPSDDLTVTRSGDTAERDERNCLTKAGVRIPVLFSLKPFSARLGDPRKPLGLVAIALDVRDRRRLELDLRQAQKLESVGRLAAGIAHEINTPMQFIGDGVTFLSDAWAEAISALTALRSGAGMTRALEGELDELVQLVPPAIEDMQQGVERVSSIVDAMRQFAHRGQTEMTRVDLVAAVRNTIVIAQGELRQVADVETELDGLPLVTCYAGEINQVLLNLIVNAAHAIQDMVAGTESKGLIRICACQAGDSVVIAISDTGGGIAADIQELVFDPFFTTKEVGRGSGQGLSLARAVIEKHQGRLSFETRPGVGTTFSIRLPIDGPRPTHVRGAGELAGAPLAELPASGCSPAPLGGEDAR